MHQSEGALGDPSCETRHFDMSFRSDDRWAFVQAKYSSWGRSAMNLAKKKKVDLLGAYDIAYRTCKDVIHGRRVIDGLSLQW